MPLFGYALRRSFVWGAICLSLLPPPAVAQLQTSVSPALPSLGEAEKDPQDPDAITCRVPQRQTDSRMLGPKVCMPNRKWDALHAQGLDIGADGKSIVGSEKYRTLHNGS